MTDRERLIELVKNSLSAYGKEARADCKPQDFIADFLIANGVIVPPCNVGDTVYKLDDFVWKSDCEECEYFDEGWYDCPSQCEKTKSCKKSPDCIEIIEETISYPAILTNIAHEYFGKKVFLTREEAEEALQSYKKDTK